MTDADIVQDKNGRYMYAPLGVRVEVWPLAADEVGIWLLSGEDSWKSLPLRSDAEPHSAVQYMMDEQGASPTLLHSTSWRMDDRSLMVTYIATIDCEAAVRDEWPEARPVSAELFQSVGKPTPTAPTEAPIPRYVDVLAHGIRHLRVLRDTDSEARTELGGPWEAHLKALSPTLTGMYEHDV